MEATAGAAGAAGANGAAKGSVSEQLTRLHRMSVDEARMILNVKGDGKGSNNALPTTEEMETLIKVRSLLLYCCG